MAPPRFGLVCLRLKGADNDGQKELLAAVNSAGRWGLLKGVCSHMCADSETVWVASKWGSERGGRSRSISCTTMHSTWWLQQACAAARHQEQEESAPCLQHRQCDRCTRHMCVWPPFTQLTNLTRCVHVSMCMFMSYPAGLSFMVGTDLDGLFTLRVAIGQANTQLEHVQKVWTIIQEQAAKMLAKQQQPPAE